MKIAEPLNCLSDISIKQMHESLKKLIEEEKEISPIKEKEIFNQYRAVYGFKSVESISWNDWIEQIENLLQKRNIPFESGIATGLNREIFRHLRVSLDDYQEELCTNNPELICPMSLRAGTKRRNIHQIAIAPTMGISNLADLTSSGIEPWIANAFAKTLIQGTYIIKNKYLTQVIIKFAKLHGLDDEWINAQWASIIKYDGSVQQLDWMDQWTKDVYKTAYEINQLAVIQQSGDRSDYIDQGQSVNLFLDAEVTWEELHAVHYKAWEVGIKSLYYLRSKAEVSAKVGGSERKPIVLEDDACIACT